MVYDRENKNLRSVNVTITMEDLVTRDGVGDDPMALALMRAVDSVVTIERQLVALGQRITDTIAKVSASLTGDADLRSVNSLGELQNDGPRYDVLCAQLDAARHQLGMIAQLFLAQEAKASAPLAATAR